MAKFGVNSTQDARRISGAVRAIEGRNLAGASAAGTDDSHDIITAKITGDDGAAVADRKYAWSQVRRTSTAYEVAGLTGTTTARYAVTGNGEAVATDDIVSLTRTPLNNGDGTFSLVWVITNPKVGLELKNDGTSALAAATSLDIPTSTHDVLTFGGSDGAGTLSLVAGATAWQVLTWNGTKWVVDFVRAHA